ncbi:heat shock 70 kDa protein 18-like [Lolium perenne]|uniref:heat shock 70 kDa protein 18-like n=1 Tax=Lolium perenne TaxID=4522 RepID=UPI0021EA6964|nr:heat shock 70 kDa protein 18-like [Lolium perenne]
MSNRHGRKERWSVIGIDLGTTYSCVGVWRDGRVEIVPNDQGNRTTPSCVAFTDGERLIGEGANNQVASNAANTVFDVKRLMGRSSSDASVESDAKYWPFGVVADGNKPPLISVSYHGEMKEFSAEEISAMVLVKMKEAAEAYLGSGTTIKQAVVTVPAYFNSSQRQATMDAGAIAGLTGMRIINEPSAAAITYNHNRKWSYDNEQSIVVVYDLGGGTLDVSLVLVKKGELHVKATAGDTHLGGEDFTNNMVVHFVKEFKQKNQKDISDNKKALGRLRRSCEEAKRRLSTNPHTTVEVDALFEGIDFRSGISRDKFKELNEDLFGRCMEPVEKCLAGAKMDKRQVDDVVLVGGCTRIPHVRQLLERFFNGKELCRNINADEAVAYGATVQAASLLAVEAAILRGVPTGIQTSCILPEVIDITPFSLGIGILEGVMCEVIEKYTTIPVSKETPAFVRVKDDRCSVDITVYEDDRAMANKFCIALEPKAKLVLDIDPDGILSILAQYKEGRKTIINQPGRFSKQEMQRMVKDVQKYKDQDEEHKKNVQARNDIQNLLFTIGNNMMNLEDSAARLPGHPEAPQEQEKETPRFQDTYSRTRNSKVQTHKPDAQAKDTMKMLQAQKDTVKKLAEMLQAQKDTVKKLADRIKNLQVIADETTQWLENKKLTTSDIIYRKNEIEGDYNSISSQIENIQARKDIQNLLFTISNNMKNLVDSAARLHHHPEPTREQEKENHGILGGLRPQKSQNKDKRKMIQADKDTIKKLLDSVRKLQELADGTTKWLQNKKLSTSDIIDVKRRTESEYHFISSQIENVKARNDIQNLLLLISDNMKNLEDSAAAILLYHTDPTREQEGHSLAEKAKDKDHREIIQAPKGTIKELPYRIKDLQKMADWHTKWLENKELSTNDIIDKKREIEDVYRSISIQMVSGHIENATH